MVHYYIQQRLSLFVCDLKIHEKTVRLNNAISPLCCRLLSSFLFLLALLHSSRAKLCLRDTRNFNLSQTLAIRGLIIIYVILLYSLILLPTRWAGLLYASTNLYLSTLIILSFYSSLVTNFKQLTNPARDQLSRSSILILYFPTIFTRVRWKRFQKFIKRQRFLGKFSREDHSFGLTEDLSIQN